MKGLLVILQLLVDFVHDVVFLALAMGKGSQVSRVLA